MRITKPLEQWTKDDVGQLVADRAREDRFLDYKRDVYQSKDDQKLCADVSALANGSGGHLLLGVDEERDEEGKPTGIPNAISGVAGNADELVRRIEQVLRNGSVDPRIPGVRVRAIEGLAPGAVIVIHAPRSWASPHMVRDSGRFFVRTSAGNHPMDAGELRAAFLAGSAVGERLRRFRLGRLANLEAGEGPASMIVDAPTLVTHVAPMSSFDDGVDRDVTLGPPPPFDRFALVTPLTTPSFNFDGILCPARPHPTLATANAYAAVLRRGIVELVEQSFFYPPRDGGVAANTIPLPALEKELSRVVANTLRFAATWDPGPFVVAVSLLNVAGAEVKQRRSLTPLAFEGNPVDRGALLFEPLLVDEAPAAADPTFLRRVFDTLAQAAGWPRSFSFDQRTGEWRDEFPGRDA